VRRVIAAVLAVSVSTIALPLTAGAARADDTPAPSATQSATADPSATPVAEPTGQPTPTTPKPPRQPNGRQLPDGTRATAEIARPEFASEVPLTKGSRGWRVKEAQDRLEWMGYPIAESDTDKEVLWDSTIAAVKKFQSKFGISASGEIGQTTWDRLKQLSGDVGELPSACLGERTLCVDKTQKLLRLVDHGKVELTLDARFGLPGTVTREGSFRVNRKSRDHWSTLYRTWMPFAMFFSGGQAVHYSPFFARDGYYGGSHGCIGLRDFKMAAWLYDHISMGTKVYVYWS
jgi:hypothetical protein